MTSEVGSVKRVKRKLKGTPNPLFEQWLREWKDEAASKNSETQYCYARALKTIKKYPVTLQTGAECIMLENFGEKLCRKLDERLEVYKASHPEEFRSLSQTLNQKSSIRTIFQIGTPKAKKRKSSDLQEQKKRKQFNDENQRSKPKSSFYIPTYRSGGYAILVAMFQKLQDNPIGHMTKAEIENEAQDFCDVSFKKPLPGTHYTAWSSVGVLIKKKLVIKEGKPVRFSLSEEGFELARKLKITEEKDVGKGTQHDISPTQDFQMQLEKPESPVSQRLEETLPKKTNRVLSQNSKISSDHDETIFMLPGMFEVVLLVDIQERDDKFQQNEGMTVRQLKTRHVNFEMRHLKVGDFIWIARHRETGAELVLPYIVERKRYDDLGSSIKDGRFHEQKFRLKKSGIENLIYLVEKYGNDHQRVGLPLPTLMQAISNTQVVDGFTIRITNNHDHSMRYLDIMTTQLSNLFKRVQHFDVLNQFLFLIHAWIKRLKTPLLVH